MPHAPRILAFAGSARRDSYNKKLVRAAAKAAQSAGAVVTVIDLRDLPLPIYDEDLEREQGLPDNARRLKTLFTANDGLLIASPEYNSSITALLKNTIDWVSRPTPGEAPLGCFDGKVAAIMSASPGALGGLRGLVTLRMILGNIKVTVLPDQLAIVKAHEAFDPAGSLKDSQLNQTVGAIAGKLVETVRRMKGD